MEPASSCRQLLERAVEAYAAAYARADRASAGDPDCSLGIAFAVGRRRLATRARAADWAVGDEVLARVGALIDAVTAAADLAAADAVATFPDALLRALERRAASSPRSLPIGRRVADLPVVPPCPRTAETPGPVRREVRVADLV